MVTLILRASSVCLWV